MFDTKEYVLERLKEVNGKKLPGWHDCCRRNFTEEFLSLMNFINEKVDEELEQMASETQEVEGETAGAV